MEEKLTIKTKIKELNFQKKKEKEKEKQYLLKNSKYIFKYFEKKKGSPAEKYDKVVLGGNKGDKSKTKPGKKDYEK